MEYIYDGTLESLERLVNDTKPLLIALSNSITIETLVKTLGITHKNVYSYMKDLKIDRDSMEFLKLHAKAFNITLDKLLLINIFYEYIMKVDFAVSNNAISVFINNDLRPILVKITTKDYSYTATKYPGQYGFICAGNDTMFILGSYLSPITSKSGVLLSSELVDCFTYYKDKKSIIRCIKSASSAINCQILVKYESEILTFHKSHWEITNEGRIEGSFAFDSEKSISRYYKVNMDNSDLHNYMNIVSPSNSSSYTYLVDVTYFHGLCCFTAGPIHN